MVYQNLSQSVDSFWLVNIKIKNIAESVSKRILWICAHMSNQINEFFILIVSLLSEEIKRVFITSQRIWIVQDAAIIALA